MASFLDIEGLVWNRSLYPAVPAFTAHDYQQVISAVVSAAAPLLKSGAVAGLFLGDEICCSGTSPKNLATVASFCRAQLTAAGHAEAHVYVNECARSFIGAGVDGGEGWPGWIKGMMPDGLSLISLDTYALTNQTNASTGVVTPFWDQEVIAARKLYERAFSGRLHPQYELQHMCQLFPDFSIENAVMIWKIWKMMILY